MTMKYPTIGESAIRQYALVGLILTAFCAAFAGADWRCDGHWLQFRGRPILLVGDSITQGWMELGTNFDQKAYLDALARRGINVLLLWSYIGIVDQTADPRIGYDAPELWPWARAKASPDAFPDAYFDRLHGLIRLNATTLWCDPGP
jgi:hypothetical protein